LAIEADQQAGAEKADRWPGTTHQQLAIGNQQSKDFVS
jgi:hypothetical protein